MDQRTMWDSVDHSEADSVHQAFAPATLSNIIYTVITYTNV